MASADLRNGTRTRVSFDSSAPRQSTRKEPSGAAVAWEPLGAT
jgi:hypothetical protein